MRSKNSTRRRHGPDFKAKVLAACNEPGASIAAVALAHGLNANLVRKWRMGRGLKLAGIAAPLGDVALSVFQATVAAGLGEQDDAAVIKAIWPGF